MMTGRLHLEQLIVPKITEDWRIGVLADSLGITPTLPPFHQYTNPLLLSEFQIARLGELAHRLFLLFVQFVGHRDLDQHDQISLRPILFDSQSRDTETLTTGRTRRDLDRNSFSIECLHADFRAQGGLGDVDRHRRDDVEAFAAIKMVRLDRKGDQQIARLAALCSLATLPLEPDLRSGIDPWRNGDHDFLAGANFAGAVARRTSL